MVATTLSQSILAGMDPSVVRNIQNIENGENYLKTGMDASPTTSWGAIGRLANALAGSYIENSSASDLAKTLAAGKKSATDTLLAALEPQRATSPVPSAPPALASPPPINPGAAPPPSLAPQAAIAPDPGSPNAQVANRFPANMSPGGTAPGAAPLPNNAPSPLDTAQYPQGPVGAPSQVAQNDPVAAINAAASKHGVNPDTLQKMAMIESSGNPNAVTGSARGLFQFMPDTAKQYGLSNPFDPAASADAAARLMKDNKAALTQALGREPTEGELYLAHQQGADGAAKLLTNPNAPAASLVGQAAITGNGGSPGMTAAQFANKWTSKFGGTPAVASDADEEAPKPGQQVAQNIDVHKLMAVMQNPYADEATKALASKLILQQLTPTEDTYGVTGESPFGGKKYGFINTKEHTINGQAADAAGNAGKGPLDNIDSSKTGEDYLKQFPPEVQSGVRDYIEGRRMPTGNPRITNIVRQVASKYGADIGVPADDASFGARHTMLNDLNKSTPGSIGGQVTSLRTASNHLASMAKDAEALGNYDTGIAPLSAIVNNVRGLGTEQAAKMQALQDDAQHYGQEITKFYSGSPGGEAERDRFMTAANGAKSPKELAAVIQAERNLIPGRGEELQNRITTTLGPQLAQKYQVHSPESLAALKSVDDSVARLRGEKPAAAATSAAPAASAPDRTAIEAEMRRRGLLQ